MTSKTVENVVILSLIILIIYMIFKLKNENLSLKDKIVPSNDNALPLNPLYRVKSYRQKNRPDKIPRGALDGIDDKANNLHDSEFLLTDSDDDVSLYLPSPVYKKINHSMTNFNLNDEDLYAFKDPADNLYPREEVNKYLDEYMNYSRFDKLKQPPTTKQDVDKYRADYINFRNMTNTNSHGFDAVDEMNLDRLNPRDMSGENIADIYDKLTAKNFDPSSMKYVGRDMTM
jgi:hypothetical protein